jgi:glutaredoxin
MKWMRFLIGRIILAVDYLTKPIPISRDSKQQSRVDDLALNMSLYQFNACPFCVKVRRHMRRHAINIELRDAKNDLAFKNELIREGGKYKVPCLRVQIDANTVEWLYSSEAICTFLTTRINQLKM